MNEILHFEQGPIRPPNEAKSLLLRFTRNCPWNQCLFCPVYKNDTFSFRSVEEIKRDIQRAKDCADDIKDLSLRMGQGGAITDDVINRIVSSPDYSYSYQSVAIWLYYDTKACFLQDADNLIMKTGDLSECLRFLRQKFPDLERVTTYSRSRTVSRKSLSEVQEIKEAGLDRVHIGLESGYGPVLKLIKKGVTPDQHVDAGRKIIESGMSLSEYIMPGLGGQSMWRNHAIETARVLNDINPHYIRLRSLRIPTRTPLYQKLVDGSFTMMTDDEVVEEIRVFIENLDDQVTSFIASDHIMNLLEEVSGKMPGDKDAMLNVIRKYQELPEDDKTIYRLGRRGGLYSSTDDLYRDDITYHKIKKFLRELSDRGPDEIDRFINETADRYV
jgi:radical SAM superfamily enzyme YgiQ (UPF0313 family)